MSYKSITLSKSLSCADKFKKFNLDSEIIKLENKKEQLLNAIKDQQARQFKKVNTQKEIKYKKQKLYNLQNDSNKMQIQLNKRLSQLQKMQKKKNESHTKREQFIKQVDQDCLKLKKQYLDFDQGKYSEQKQLKYQFNKDRIYMKLIDRQISINRHLQQLIKHAQQNKQHEQLSQSNNLNKTIQLKFNKLLIRYCINNGAILLLTDLNKNRNKKYYGDRLQQQATWRNRRYLRIRQWQQNWNNNVKQNQQQQQQIDLWQNMDISLDVLNQLQLDRYVYDDQDYKQLFPQPQYCNNHKQVNKPTRLHSQYVNKTDIIQSYFIELYEFIIKNDLVIKFKQYLFKQIQNTIQNLQIDQNSIFKTNLTIEIDGLINDLSQLNKVKTIQKKNNRKINNNDNINNIYASQTTTTTKKYTRTLSKLIDKKIYYRQTIFKQHKMLNHQLLSMREIIQRLQRQQQKINRIKVQVSKQVQSSQRQLKSYGLSNQYDGKQNTKHLVNDIQQIDSAIIYLKSKYSDKNSNKQNNNSLLQNSLISSNSQYRQQLISKRTTTTSIQQALQKSNQTNYQNNKDNHKFQGLNKVQSMVNINHNSSIKLTLYNHGKTIIYQYQQQQQQQRFIKNNINNKSTLSLLHIKKSVNSRQANQNQQNIKNNNNNKQNKQNKQNKINNQLKTPSIPNSPKIKFSSSQQTTDCKSPLMIPFIQSTNKYIDRNCSKSKHNSNTLLMAKSSSLKQLKTTKNNKNNNIYDFMTKKITVTNNKGTNKLKLL